LNEKITVFPKSPLCIALWTISLIFPAVLTAIAFMMLIDGDTVLFVPFMSFALVGGYLCIRTVFFRVSFIDDRIVTSRHTCQKEPLDIECGRLLTGTFISEGAEGALRSYLRFRCKDDEERRIYSNLFSERQLLQIVELIKERGGLREQNVEEIMSGAPGRKEKERSARS